MNWWSVDEWSIAHFWRWSDLVQRAILIGLALTLGYTFFVLIRFICVCYASRREFPEFGKDSSGDFSANNRRLIADLSRGLGTLRGIAYASPILALAGTIYGILAAPSWFRYSSVNGLIRDFASTLINTAFGILVAVPATLSHNLLRTFIETLSGRLLPMRTPDESNLRSCLFAQTLPLKKRLSGPPHFALIAAPFLACVVMAYMAFKPYPTLRGVPVRLLPMGPLSAVDKSAMPPVVSVLLGADREPVIRVNSKHIPFEQMETLVGQNLQGLPERQAFVEGDSDAPWGYVVDRIDRIEGLHCRVILLTNSPERKGKLRPIRR